MALYTCTKCGKKVPWEYEVCPYCQTERPTVSEKLVDINKMKQCKDCGKLIAKSAKTCPNCGAKQKKKHPILGIFLILLGVIIAASVLGGNPNKGPAKIGSSSESRSQVENEIQDDAIFFVGDEVELDGVIVSLNSVTENNGKDFLKPADGNVFLLCEFTIENNSNKELNISSMLCFDGYVDDYSTSMSITAQSSTDKGQLDGTVAAGKKMNGVVGYEVDSDWKKVEIHFTPSFWSGKDIIFAYEK